MEVGRLLNADDVHYLGEEGISCNLFTYCVNNPVNNKDENGMFLKKLRKKISPYMEVFSVVANFASFVVSWLSLSGKIKNKIIGITAGASVLAGIWNYSKDRITYRKSKSKLYWCSVSFAICIASNVITIVLSSFNLVTCKSYIKKFLWFLGTSFGIAISTCGWVYDLVLKPRVAYKWVKTKVRC